MNIDNICRYLGVKIPTDDLIKKIEYVISEAKKTIKPAIIYSTCSISKIENGIALDNTDLILIGNLAKTYFDGCKNTIIVAATLTLSSEIFIKRMFSKSSEYGTIADAVLTEMVEDVLDSFEENLNNNGKKFKSRISCGYGDLDLKYELDLYNYLNAQSIGISINNSFMKTPNKSVIALIGELE